MLKYGFMSFCISMWSQGYPRVWWLIRPAVCGYGGNWRTGSGHCCRFWRWILFLNHAINSNEHADVCISMCAKISFFLYEVRLQEEEESLEEMKLLPHKHDIISVLGVGGHWVTSHKGLQVTHQLCKDKQNMNQALLFLLLLSYIFLFFIVFIFVLPQLDPPDCRLLFLKSASVTFLNPEVWMASSAQQGRYLRILNS